MNPPREVRYFAVVVLGYSVDFAASFSVFKLLHISLEAAACIGFVLGVIFNYLAHEFWTFAGERHTGYIWRFGKFVGVSLFILALRVAVIWLIEPYAASDLAHAAALIGAAALSLVVNYLLTLFAVFGGRRRSIPARYAGRVVNQSPVSINDSRVVTGCPSPIAASRESRPTR
jgi:putative flippase GtrA